ncbi:uncharacterized protein [Battus philenor]|uniref:uncharacterized protein n=1 Tax=Battus philenor TaxID=42288 RepID=UPI0035CFB271
MENLIKNNEPRKFYEEIMEKKWEYAQSIHSLFVDFRKAYDSIDRSALYNILCGFNIPAKLVRMVKTVTSESIMRVRAGDDLALMGENYNEIQESAKALEEEATKVSLKINTKKTEYLHMKRYKNKRVKRDDLHIGNVLYARVAKFWYLGCTISDDNTREEEIDIRIQNSLRCSANVFGHDCKRNRRRKQICNTGKPKNAKSQKDGTLFTLGDQPGTETAKS